MRLPDFEKKEKTQEDEDFPVRSDFQINKK